MTVSFLVSAQIDDSDLRAYIVSEGGLYVRHPDDWYSESPASESLTVIEYPFSITLRIYTGDDLVAINNSTETDARAMVEEYREVMKIMLTDVSPDIEIVELANGIAYIWMYSYADDALSTGVIGIQLANGDVVGVLVNVSGIFDDAREEVVGILRTVETGVAILVEPPVPMNVVAESDLPANAFQLVGDIAFTIPEGYSDSNTLQPENEQVGIISDDNNGALTVGVMEDASYVFMRTGLISVLFPGISESPDIDDAFQLQPTMLNDGRVIYLVSTTGIRGDEIRDGLYAEFDATNDTIFYVLALGIGEHNVDKLKNDVVAIIESVSVIEGGASDPDVADAEDRD